MEIAIFPKIDNLNSMMINRFHNPTQPLLNIHIYLPHFQNKKFCNLLYFIKVFVIDLLILLNIQYFYYHPHPIIIYFFILFNSFILLIFGLSFLMVQNKEIIFNF